MPYRWRIYSETYGQCIKPCRHLETRMPWFLTFCIGSDLFFTGWATTAYLRDLDLRGRLSFNFSFHHNTTLTPPVTQDGRAGDD